MDMKRYMKALPAVAALLLTAACSSDDFETIETPQPAKERIIHFTANVDNGAATRATLSYDRYYFVSGDKLYVWGENISGELTTTGSGTSATFTGDLTYTGEGEPKGIFLNAVVKGVNDQILGSFDDFKARGYVPSYTNGIASNITDAVEKCSYLTSSNNYCDFGDDEPSCGFELVQQSAFISYDITLEDGTAEGENITVTVNNGGSAVCSGSVKTVKVGDAIKAQFTAAFLGGTTLSGATVKLGTRDAISFASSNPTLSGNNNYRVTKSYGNYKLTVSAYGENQSSTFKVLPHEYGSTIEEMLTGFGFEDVSITDCTYQSGDDIITVTDTGTAHKLKATAKGEGIYNVTGTAKIVITNPFNGHTKEEEAPLPLDITFKVEDNPGE
jgi:hypothetical protein